MADASDLREEADQAGVIPWRRTSDTVEILLITSRLGDRWIVPKGWIEEGSTPRECARVEALEEAGVRGRLSRRPAGLFRFQRGERVLVVRLYDLEVRTVMDHWPEEDIRRRC